MEVDDSHFMQSDGCLNPGPSSQGQGSWVHLWPWGIIRLMTHEATCGSIWRKSDLYLRYHIEDLITPHYWSCSSELCINFVVWILLHDFDKSDSLIKRIAEFLKMMKFTFSCHLGHVVFSDLNGQNIKTSEILSDTRNFGLIFGQYNKHWTRPVMGSYQILYAITVWL